MTTTDPPETRNFTPARIVALALIGLVVLGLGYLRFAPSPGPVSVPHGAHAGQLILKPCSYATENGSYAADCGTLVVPENRANPQSRLIALPVTRIRARTAHPGAPVFRLEGGPGKTNMQFPDASRFAGRHDVVMVGYRGADGSVQLDCPEVDAALAHSADFLSQQSLRAYGGAMRACAARLSAEGVDLAGYTMNQQAADIEAARVALGYHRIDLLSESAGTRLAMIYAWRYPASVYRSVMIGVNPPGNFLWYPKTTDQQIARYVALCAHDTSCRQRTSDLAALIQRTATHLPSHWGILPIKKGNVQVATFFGLMESQPQAGPFSAPATVDTWLSAAHGDPSGLWLSSLAADLIFPKAFVWGEYAAMGRADFQAARGYFGEQQHGWNLGRAATSFFWGGGQLADAFPAAPGQSAYSRVRTSKVPTLLISGALDFATPPQTTAKELLPYLPNGHQVVLPGFGHSATFWNYQPQAGTRLINTYLDTGRVDTSLYTPAKVDFTPRTTFPALAKEIVAMMTGLAVLMVLSLLWMARRVHKKGRLGPKASVILRSVFPLVLGLGGWFLGALTVLVTMPRVPLDDPLLATISVGVPAGLGIYLAWVNRDWSAKAKTSGFAAAAAGALAGAWLGFHATTGLLALITTIIAAAAGANLLLLALDITWDRQTHDRFPETNVKEMLEAPAPTG
jgi:pimeloyl-ACP methyl ester carboxylesterase